MGRKCMAIVMVALLSSCATNPQTGKLEVAPAVQHDIDSVKKEVGSIYDSPDPCSNNDRNIGITVGVVAGAIIGHAMGNNNTGTLIGAAVGGGAGGLVGHDMDARRCALSKIASANHLVLASAAITEEKLGEKTQGAPVGLDVAIRNDDSDGEFVPGTSRLTQKARKAYGEIADQYQPGMLVSGADAATRNGALNAAKQRKVLIVGHAAEGEDSKNSAKLSADRAEAVAQVFAQHGVPKANIFYQGAGDSLPVASNATQKGRSENRRIEIVDVRNEGDLKRYLNRRVPDPRHFASNAAPSSPTTKHSRSYDFGGSPSTGADEINLGNKIDSSSLSLIRSANAAEPVVVGSCVKDRPHDSTSVRNLSTGSALPVEDAIAGLYGEPITGMMNGNLVAILNAYAPKDAGVPAPEPKLEIYKDYAKKHVARPSFAKTVPVYVYRGTDATLYRLFVNGPMECMDVVVKSSIGGKVYYIRDGKQYVASGNFIERK